MSDIQLLIAQAREQLEGIGLDPDDFTDAEVIDLARSNSTTCW